MAIGACWGDPEREYRGLKQNLLHDHAQHGRHRRVVQLAEPVKGGEVGGDRKREQRADHEGRFGSLCLAPAAISAVRFVSAPRFASTPRSPLLEALVAAHGEDQDDDELASGQRKDNRWMSGVLGRLVEARTLAKTITMPSVTLVSIAPSHSSSRGAEAGA